MSRGTKPEPSTRKWPIRPALCALLVFAFVLRTWNLDWDNGTHLQPDERFWSDVAANVHTPDEWVWGEVLDPDQSTLNPRNFKPNYVYGTLPLWSSEAAAAVLMNENMAWAVQGLDSAGIDLIHDARPDDPVSTRLRFNTGFDVTLVGRLMSALVDTATVAAVFLLARELGDRRTGLLAAALQALTVLHIQYSHFLGSEPWVAFFVTVVAWGAVRLARHRGGWPTRLVTAVALGLAIGSKLSGIAGAVAPLVAALVTMGPDLNAVFRSRVRPGLFARIWRTAEPWLVMAVVSVVAYRIAQPYDFEAGISLVFNERFQSDIEYLQDINGGGNWPWVQPLVGATPLLHPLEQLFWWGMGPGLALAGLFGCVRAVRRFMAGERFWAVPLAVVGAYLVLVAMQFYAIVRYLQPAYPILTALAGCGLIAAWRWACSCVETKLIVSLAIRAMVLLSVALTVFWALAFVNGVYGRDNARLAAGDWMVENLAKGSVVSHQSWDDPLPWGRSSPFEQVTLEPFSFGGDTPERIELLIQGLNQVDYVIESSNKFYDSLPNTPARFPQMTRYYETLFDGSLGFELVARFNNPPSLFGLTIDDSGAEEAFTLYDHPTVLIWEKTDRYKQSRAYELLNPDRARTAVNAIPADGYANGAMLRPDAYQTQQTGSSFSDVHPASSSSMVAAISWFALIQFAAFAVAPTLLRRAGEAAGAVWGLTKMLGLIALALPVWLVVSWGWLTFSGPLVWLSLLVLLGFGVRGFVAHFDQMAEIWQRHKNMIIAAELVFTTMFLAVLALRFANPDLWHAWRGGEKPMELAYFTAVTGSTTFPPYDPWFAGGSLNYYYYGWYLLAVPTRILGIQPSVAFNLGVATYAAVAASTAFSTAAMLTTVAARQTRRRLPVIGAGLLGTLLFVVVGNLDSLRQVVSRIRNDQPVGDFDWWDPSRVNKHGPGLEVTEFPSWTILFGDLHPHFMAMGIFGLGLAGSFALIDRARKGAVRDTWVLALGLGIGTGVMRMVHTWDLPTFGVAAGGAVIIAALLGRAPFWWRVRTAAGQLLLIATAHLFVTAPYRASSQVADSGFSRNQWVTNLDDWLIHWGVFFFVGAAYVLTRLAEHRRRVRLRRAQRELAHSEPARRSASPSLIGLAAVVSTGVFGFGALHVTVGSVAAWTFFGLVLALVLLRTELSRQRVSSAHVMAAALWSLGFAVLLGVELFTQNADIQRLNTVFKFWLQVWHLFAVASAFSAIWVLDTLRRFAFARHAATQQATTAEIALATNAGATERVQGAGVANPGPSPAGIGRRMFAGGLVALILAASLFPILSVRPRSSNRIDTTLGPSLYGHLWMEPGVTEFGIKDAFNNDTVIDPGLDRPLVEWLQQNVAGRPTIVEAVGGAEYQWWGRMSITTGLPTVLGWRWHQAQQRTLFANKVDQRKGEVASFYTTNSVEEIESFLRAYDVSFVIVGAVETQIANPETLRLLGDHPALTAVFRSGDQVIYEVAKRWLTQSSGPIASIGSG